MAHAEKLLRIVTEAERRRSESEAEIHNRVRGDLAAAVECARSPLARRIARARLTRHESVRLLAEAQSLESEVAEALERARRVADGAPAPPPGGSDLDSGAAEA